MKRLRPLLLVGTLLSPPALATAVFGVRTSDEVVLAVDSRIRVISGRQINDDVGCKLHITDGTLWTHVGYYSNPQSGFDLTTVAEVALRSPGTIREKLTVFAESSLGPIQRMLSGLRESNPEEYSRSGHDPVTIIAAALEHETPYLAMLRFSANNPSGLTYTIHICPGDCAGGMEYASFGVHEEADEKFDSTPHYFAAMGWREGMIGLLSVEAAKHPDKVSPPYAIVKYMKSGLRWIDIGPCISLQPGQK